MPNESSGKDPVAEITNGIYFPWTPNGIDPRWIPIGIAIQWFHPGFCGYPEGILGTIKWKPLWSPYGMGIFCESDGNPVGALWSAKRNPTGDPMEA